MVQVHYNTLTQPPRPDQSAIVFKVDDEVDQPAEFFLWADPRWLQGNMPIPAGDAQVKHRFAFDPTPFLSNDRPITFYSGFIHMHLLGEPARMYIERDDGDGCLIDIPRYDFNWQGGVVFKEPKTLNPGERLILECTWDNSMENQPVLEGQQIQPEDQNWGDGTRDEMCLGVFYVTYD